MTKSLDFVLSGIPGPSSPFGFANPNGTNAELKSRYERLALAYERGLLALGASVARLDAPSIYHSAEAQATIGVSPQSIHISVRPIADIRPFHGLPNHAVFDGPASELGHKVSGSLRSAGEILATLASILCTTAKLAEELQARGISRAAFLPPPVMQPSALMSEEQALGRLTAVPQTDESALAFKSIRDAVRAKAGQILYWDHQAGDADTALEMLFHAAEEMDLRATNSILVIASEHNPFPGRTNASKRRPPNDIYWVDATGDDDLKFALLRACDIFIRTAGRSGIDLDLLSAVEGGALALIPAGHSAIELIDSGAVVPFVAELSSAGLGRAKRPQCPDLIRAVGIAMTASAADRRARGDKARDWLISRFGPENFAAEIRSKVLAR